MEAIERKYKQDETDEFLKPLIVNGDAGRIKGPSGNIGCSACYLTPFCFTTEGDTLFCLNYRSDRMREIVSALGLPDKPMEVDAPKDLVSASAPIPRVSISTQAQTSST